MLDLDSVIAVGLLGAVKAASHVRYRRWSPGRKPRVLLVGLVGKGNLGGEARALAIVEGLRRAWGADTFDVSVMSMNPRQTRARMPEGVHVIPLSVVFYKDVFRACCEHDVALVAEGNFLKSYYSNALTLLFSEAMGVMGAQGKPAFAYGCEVAQMEPLIEYTAQRLCRDTVFLGRTAPVVEAASVLGLESHLGTDPAWSLAPAPESWARTELARLGVAAEAPLLGVALMDPFSWPVRPDLARLARAALTRDWSRHVGRFYFFSDSAERRAARARYVETLARAIDELSAAHGARVVITAEDESDEFLCQMLAERLRTPSALFLPSAYDPGHWAALLRRVDLLVTTSYHARVLTLGSAIPAVALSADERLANQFAECGQGALSISCYDDALATRLPAVLAEAWERRSAIAADLRRLYPDYLARAEGMATFVGERLAKDLPGFSPASPFARRGGVLGGA